MQVEPSFHHLAGIATEVAPVVLICERRGGYRCSRREPAQCLLVRLMERAVNRLELVILVFAHGIEVLPDRVQLGCMGHPARDELRRQCLGRTAFRVDSRHGRLVQDGGEPR